VSVIQRWLLSRLSKANQFCLLFRPVNFYLIAILHLFICGLVFWLIGYIFTFSSVSTHYHHQMGFDPTGNQHFSGNGYGHRRQHRLHQRRNHGGSSVGSNGSQNKSNQVKNTTITCILQ